MIKQFKQGIVKCLICYFLQEAIKEVEVELKGVQEEMAKIEEEVKGLKKDEIEIKHELEKYQTVVKDNALKIKHWKKEVSGSQELCKIHCQIWSYLEVQII